MKTPVCTSTVTSEKPASNSGTPTEADAVDHVVKLRGVDWGGDSRSLNMSADIVTDLNGGILGGQTDTAGLISGVFLDWTEAKGLETDGFSDNTYVQVVGSDGDMLDNANTNA